MSQGLAEPAVAPPDRLSLWQRLGLGAFFTLLLLLVVVVEFRSAFLTKRMGDLDIFLRAAWALHAGIDVYSVTDDDVVYPELGHGDHYNYPPLLAVLLMPLADPPPGVDRTGFVPYTVSVAIWYFVNLALLGFGVHRLARAIAKSDPDARGRLLWSRSWWGLRILPVLILLIPIGHSLIRGQSNMLVLACLCASVAASIRGKRFQGGFWLAGAISVKMFPAFLGLYFVWRRDVRALAGCAAGLFATLVAIPAIVLGPAQTTACYERLVEVVVLPGIGLGVDETRATELTTVAAVSDNQSLLSVTHKTLYPDEAVRPIQASSAVRWGTVVVGLLLTLVPLIAFGWRRREDPQSMLLLFGCLIVNMLLLSPVCHLHYYSFGLPLVAGLIAARWQSSSSPQRGLAMGVLFVLVAVGQLLPHLPALKPVRELGLAAYLMVALWCVAIVMIWRRRMASV